MRGLSWSPEGSREEEDLLVRSARIRCVASARRRRRWLERGGADAECGQVADSV